MIYKPHIESVPLPKALAWTGGNGYLYEEKLDGRFTEMPQGNSLLVGETVGARFVAFDVVTYCGADVRHRSIQERLSLLPQFPFPNPARGNGGEFLEAILARGGEGCVAKELGQPYGRGWFKAKRCQVFYVIVTRKATDGRQSVDIKFAPFQDVKNPMPQNVGFQDIKNLEPAGSLALRGAKFDAVRVGSILKLEAFGKHASGLLREARLDGDAPGSWLVKW